MYATDIICSWRWLSNNGIADSYWDCILHGNLVIHRHGHELLDRVIYLWLNYMLFMNKSILILILFNKIWLWFMVFNATFNNISVISWRFAITDITVSFIGGGNRRKPPTCRKSLTNFFHIMLYRVHLAMCRVRTHNFSGDMH